MRLFEAIIEANHRAAAGDHVTALAVIGMAAYD